MQSTADSGVGNTQLFTYSIDLALIPDESDNERQVLSADLAERPGFKMALNRGVAVPAVQPCYLQWIAAYRTLS